MGDNLFHTSLILTKRAKYVIEPALSESERILSIGQVGASVLHLLSPHARYLDYQVISQHIGI